MRPQNTPTERKPSEYLLRLLLLLVLVEAALLLLRAARADAATALPKPLSDLCARIEADPLQPAWKQALVPVIRSRRIGRFEARLTTYCPNSSLDPLGGGPFAAWGGLRLRDHHCAVGTTVRAVPLGTVVFCPAAKRQLLVAVDTGPGVQGMDRLDLCYTDPKEYLASDRLNWTRQTTWVLGRVSAREAR